MVCEFKSQGCHGTKLAMHLLEDRVCYRVTLQSVVTQHKQQFVKIPLAGFMCLRGSTCCPTFLVVGSYFVMWDSWCVGIGRKIYNIGSRFEPKVNCIIILIQSHLAPFYHCFVTCIKVVAVINPAFSLLLQNICKQHTFILSHFLQAAFIFAQSFHLQRAFWPF